jgi:hypothetical protein
MRPFLLGVPQNTENRSCSTEPFPFSLAATAWNA